MKKKYFYPAFAAALLFAGFAFTACDDDDDNSAPGTKPTIKFENVIPTKNYVQSGSFARRRPRENDVVHLLRRQRAAPDVRRHVFQFQRPVLRPGESGHPALQRFGSALYRHHCRCRETLGQRNPRKRTARPQCQSSGRSPGRRSDRSKGTDSEGHNYPAASSLLQVSPDFRCRTVAVHLYDLQYFGRHGE